MREPRTRVRAGRGTVRVLAACAASGCARVVVASSGKVHADAPGAAPRAAPIDASVRPRPRDLYSCTKLFAARRLPAPFRACSAPGELKLSSGSARASDQYEYCYLVGIELALAYMPGSFLRFRSAPFG